MTIGSAAASETMGSARWPDLIPGPTFAAATAAALLGSPHAARAAIGDCLSAGTLVAVDGGTTAEVTRYRRTSKPFDTVVPPGDDRERAAVLRMLRYLLCTLVGIDEHLSPGRYRAFDPDDSLDVPTFADDTAAMAWFIAEVETVHAAQRLAVAVGEDVLVRRIGGASWTASQLHGRLQDVLDLQTLAAEAAERSDHPASSVAHARRCWALLHLGRPDDAARAGIHALERAERYGHSVSRSTALTALGNAYRAQGQYDDALESYEIAADFDHHRARLGPDGVTVTLPWGALGLRWHGIALTHLDGGSLSDALAAALTAVGHLERDQHYDRRDVAAARTTLGRALLRASRPSEAVTVLRSAITLLTPSVDQWALAGIHDLLGSALLATDALSAAARHFRTSIDLFEQAGRPARADAVRDRLDACAPPHVVADGDPVNAQRRDVHRDGGSGA